MALLQLSRLATKRQSARRGRWPGIEGLESRQLLAASITEFPVTAPGSAIVDGPDGNLWFLQNQAIGSYNPTTHAASTVPLPGAFNLNGLTDGPDGNLWFTNLFYNGAVEFGAVGSFNPTTHAVAEYRVPTEDPDLGLGGITTGPDGNLWFTEATQVNTGAIGMINPTTHAIGQFPLPTPPLNPDARTGIPEAITAGPGGDLWFTLQSSPFLDNFNGIGSIDPTTHAILEYPIPLNVGFPQAITDGPDGNLWFTAGDSVGILNPTTGAVDSIPVATGVVTGSPGITTGPDGNLWFTEYDTNQVGSINPATHALAEYVIPTPRSGAYGITTGPGDTLYFTEGNVPQIGEVSLLPGSSTTLDASPNPVNLGKPLTLTATVVPVSGAGTPTGTVTFFNGGSTVLGVAPVNAAGQATFTFSTLPFGLNELTAHYSGDAALAASFSNVITEYVAPPDGPRVLAVARLGVHYAPTTLVLAFDEPLSPETAQDPSNYRIVGPGRQTISVKTAIYTSPRPTP